MFPNLYGFGGSDPRVSVDGRPKRIKKYTDSNESRCSLLLPYYNIFTMFTFTNSKKEQTLVKVTQNNCRANRAE